MVAVVRWRWRTRSASAFRDLVAKNFGLFLSRKKAGDAQLSAELVRRSASALRGDAASSRAASETNSELSNVFHTSVLALTFSF